MAGTPFAITAARARRDMVDARGRGDMTGMLLPIEPTDSIDAAHPSEPMDRNEPVEQIDWNESLLRRTTWTGQPGSHAHPVKGTSLGHELSDGAVVSVGPAAAAAPSVRMRWMRPPSPACPRPRDQERFFIPGSCRTTLGLGTGYLGYGHGGCVGGWEPDGGKCAQGHDGCAGKDGRAQA